MMYPLHVSSRVTKDWKPRNYNYDPAEKETVRRLRKLRIHKDRQDPYVMAEELREIEALHPIEKWGEQARKVFAGLFGNNNPSRGITMRMAVEKCYGMDQTKRMVAVNILTGKHLEGRRDKRASAHGKLLGVLTRLMVMRVVDERLN